MNLAEVMYYEDPVDAWAAEREHELRITRWHVRESNTMSGAAIRMAEAMGEVGRALRLPVEQAIRKAVDAGQDPVL